MKWIQERIKILAEMDEFLATHTRDNIYLELWGKAMPCACDYRELQKIAIDEECYRLAKKIFFECLELALYQY